MRIDGLFPYKAANKRYVPPGAITVRIGEPVRYAGDTSPESVTADLERRMREL